MPHRLAGGRGIIWRNRVKKAKLLYHAESYVMFAYVNTKLVRLGGSVRHEYTSGYEMSHR